jgi:hypothetical protein
MSPVRRVFISYAHESTEHVETVRRLWELLRANGVDAQLDLAASAVRQDWVLWMTGQLQRSDYVLVIASAAYRRRSEGTAGAAEGRGVQFEAAILRDLLYADRAEWTRRMLPVILPGASTDGLPVWIGPAAGTTYRVPDLTATGIEPLLRVITDQPETVEPPLGAVPHLPARSEPAQSEPAQSEPAQSEPARGGPAGYGGGRPVSPPPVPVPAPVSAVHRLEELGALVDALQQLAEFGSQPGRAEILSWLPPEIRGDIPDHAKARMHLIAIVRTCARFGEYGRRELLAILRLALPAGDPDVQRAIQLIETAEIFV